MTYTLLIAAIVGIAAVLIGLEITRGIRHKKRMLQHDAVLRRLQNDVHALCAGSINMGNYLSSLEKRMSRLAERQDQLEVRDPIQQSYTHAIRLAQRGVDVNELMEQCGLARGEAELLLRVHSVKGRHAVSG